MTQPVWAGMIETCGEWLNHSALSDPTLAGWDDWNAERSGRHYWKKQTQPSRVGMIETDIFAAISLGCSTQPSRAGMIETVHCRSTVPALRTQPPRAGMIETILCSLISASWPWPSSHRLGWLKFCYRNKSNSHLRPSPKGSGWLKAMNFNRYISRSSDLARMGWDDWNSVRGLTSICLEGTQPSRVGMIEMRKYIQHAVWY